MTQAPSSPPLPPQIAYNPTSFSQGRMDFAWEELSDDELRQAYADWEAGKGLIGGDPRRRPGSHLLPAWGIDQPFFRALALDDERGENGANLRSVLASERPLEIEIGFGRGDFLLDRAARHPAAVFLGYETRTKAVRLYLARVARFGLANLWLSDDDARFNLPRVVPDARVDIMHVLFPDPWWKSQHRVKRLFSPPFVELLAAKLRPGGLLHFKSDVQDYGELVRYLVTTHGAFAVGNAGEHSEPAQRIGSYAPTHREHWCRRHDKLVWTYFFVRK